jgi:hypothetical protein
MTRIPLAVLAAVCTLAPALAPTSAHARPGEPARSGPWSVQLVDERGRSLPTFFHEGRTYVLGARGQRYLLRVQNDSPRRIEVVASVDGRDVVDGKPASVDKRGYLVEAGGTLTVDGFRLSESSVAAFLFSTVARSYAARMGDARDVGVIGVAVFPERERPRPVPAPIQPWQRDGWNEAEPEANRGSAPAPSSAEAQASAPSAQSGARGKASGDVARAERRPGLGTEFGEAHVSPVEHVAFERASGTPAAVLTVRYDDRPGLARLGIDVDRRLARGDDRRLRESAQPFRGSYAEPPPGW